MLQAAALLCGLFLLWLLFTQGWSGGVATLALGAGAALFGVLWAARFGGAQHAGFASALGKFVLALRRAPDVLAGAFSTVRAAIAADVTLKPALVRVKPRPASDDARSALAAAITAAPGAIVVEADADGLLVHVIDEDAVEAQHLGALEARVLAAVGERGAA